MKPESKESIDERRFEGYLIVDYRNGSMRTSKKLIRNPKPFEIPIRVDLTLRIPKTPEIVAKGDIEISPVKVREMVLHSL